jgi:acetyl-CoA C-acetyltransferase
VSQRGEVAIVAARRTPIGTAGHGMAGVTAAELAGAALEAVGQDLRALGLEPATAAEVILGNCMGPGGNLARVAALTAGLPDTMPGLTVDRQCASGLAAIVLGVSMVGAERTSLVLAGGVESASTAPWRFWRPDGDKPAHRYERAPFAPNGFDPEMGLAADLLAAEAGVSRERQDGYAARSHALALAAQAAGAFTAELVPLAGFSADERPRARFTPDRMARFPAAFRPGGTVTAANSCANSDGAAALALIRDEDRSRLGLPGLRVLGTATAGVDPRRPGLGIVPAVRTALDDAGLRLDEVDVIEFNEAFAGQVLACADQLGLAEERICTEGGAIALGHPWGASGAVLVVRLFSQLVRAGAGSYGLAAIAAGGGQGVALVVEACR